MNMWGWVGRWGVLRRFCLGIFCGVLGRLEFGEWIENGFVVLVAVDRSPM